MWRYHNPVRVTFGDGALDRLGPALAGRRYGLVTYGEPLFRDLAARVAAASGEPELVVAEVAANPDFDLLQRLCARLGGQPRRLGCLVALGGGSVIDTAKVLAASAGDFSRVRAILADPVANRGQDAIPIIAVPTTAGTGSEVTCWATLWDQAAGKKHSLALPALYPEEAIVDPVLTRGLPRALTVGTALDALSHALEAIWNVNANAVSTQFAVVAAREVLRLLPALVESIGAESIGAESIGAESIAVDGGGSAALRRRMAKAALFAGLAFSNTRTALAHALSYPITLAHGVPHGIACSFSLPMVMRAAIGRDAACDEALEAIFGTGPRQGADQLAGFLEQLGVATTVSAHGPDEQAFQAMVEEALAGDRGRNFIGDPARARQALVYS